MSDEASRPVLSPDQVASLAEETMKTCNKASQQLEGLGRAAINMAETFNQKCRGLAHDIGERGKGVSESVVNFAQTIDELAEKVDLIAKSNSAPTVADQMTDASRLPRALPRFLTEQER